MIWFVRYMAHVALGLLTGSASGWLIYSLSSWMTQILGPDSVIAGIAYLALALMVLVAWLVVTLRLGRWIGALHTDLGRARIYAEGATLSLMAGAIGATIVLAPLIVACSEHGLCP